MPYTKLKQNRLLSDIELINIMCYTKRPQCPSYFWAVLLEKDGQQVLKQGLQGFMQNCNM